MAIKVHDVPDPGNIPSCHDGRAIFEGSNPVHILVRNDLTLAPDDFQSRLRVLLGLRGAVLTDDELSQMADSYPRCGGKGPWDVRQYVARGGAGAREYRVVRARGNTAWCGARVSRTCIAVPTGSRRMRWARRSTSSRRSSGPPI